MRRTIGLLRGAAAIGALVAASVLAAGGMADAAVKRAQDEGPRERSERGESRGPDGLLNTAHDFALKKLDRQITFYKDKADVKNVDEALGATKLMKSALPTIPKVPAAESE